MGSIDFWISAHLDALAGRSWALDTFFLILAANTFTKGFVFVTLYGWAWFRPEVEDIRRKQLLLCGMLSPFVATVFARAVAVSMPFRVRPLHNPALHWHLAYGVDPGRLILWSSFPSDHAAFFAALAAGLWLVSRRAGVAAFCYTLVMIDFPRLYLGFHYFSDLMVGTALGVAFACVLAESRVREFTTKPLLRIAEESPAYFYAGFSLLMFVIGIHFEPLLELLSFSHQLARTALPVLTRDLRVHHLTMLAEGSGLIALFGAGAWMTKWAIRHEQNSRAGLHLH